MTAITGFAGPSGDHSGFVSMGSLAIAVVFGILGGLAAVAPLDSAAIAPGRVAAETSTKPIQHLEGGIVREILVKEAQAVMEGQVLFRLEPTQARANSELLRKQLETALAHEARLSAEREGQSNVTVPATLAKSRDAAETASEIADQERQFAERRATLDNQTTILRTRRDQAAKEIDGLQRRVTMTKEQIESLSADIANLGELQKKGLYPKSKLNALHRERSRLEGEVAGHQGEIARLGEVQREADQQITQLEQKFRADAGQQLNEVRGRISEVREKLTVAEDVMSRIEIRAPQNGIVQGVKVYAPGAVVRPGEVLAELVPTGDKLVMAVRVSPLDIDSVEKGQNAEVRLPGFSSRGMKTIMGRVERVGADVMLDDYTKEPYYMARVEVDTQTVTDEVKRKLQPGMPADVLITTGERTILQYLVGPITDLLFKSMREQ